LKRSVNAGQEEEISPTMRRLLPQDMKEKKFSFTAITAACIYRFLCRRLYGLNSDRLWVTKILRSAKREVWSCLKIRGTIVNGYRSKTSTVYQRTAKFINRCCSNKRASCRRQKTGSMRCVVV